MAKPSQHPAWQTADPAVRRELLEFMAVNGIDPTRSAESGSVSVAPATKIRPSPPKKPDPATTAKYAPGVTAMEKAAARPTTVSAAPTPKPKPPSAWMRAAPKETVRKWEPTPAAVRAADAARRMALDIDQAARDFGEAALDPIPREGDIEHNEALMRAGGKVGGAIGTALNLPSLKGTLAGAKAAALMGKDMAPLALGAMFGGKAVRNLGGKAVKPVEAPRDALMRSVSGLGDEAEKIVPKAGGPPNPPPPRPPGGGGEPPPEFDPNDYLLMRKQDIPDEQAKLLSRQIYERSLVAPKTKTTHAKFIEDWKAENPDRIKDLKPVDKYNPLGSKEFAMVNARMNTFDDEAIRLRTEAINQKGVLTDDEFRAKMGEANKFLKLANDDLALLIPSRSGKGLGLNLLKLHSAKTMDTSYWVGTAMNVAGGSLPEATQIEIKGITREGQQLLAAESQIKAAMDAGNLDEAAKVADEVLAHPSLEKLTAKAGKKQVEVEGYQEAVDAAKARLKELAKERLSLRAKLSTAGRRISKKEEQVQELQPIVEANKAEAAQLQEALSRLKAQQSEIDKGLVSGAEDVARRQANINQYQTELDALRQRLGLAKDEESLLRTEQRSLKGKVKRADARLAKIEAANQGLQQALTATRKRLVKTVDDLNTSGLWETAMSASNAFLIANPVTLARNLASNGIQLPTKELARLPAASADWIMSLGTGRRTVSPASLGALVRGSKDAITKGVPEAMDIMGFPAAYKDLSEGKGVGSAFESMMETGGVRPEDLAKMEATKELHSGSKILDTLANLGFRSATAQDRLGRAAAFRRSIEEQAWLRVHNNPNLSKAEKKAAWLELRDKPTDQLLADAATEADLRIFMRENADLFADTMTFNRGNVVSRMLGSGRQYLKQKGDKAEVADHLLMGLLDVTIRFSRVPTNVATEAMKLTPASLITGPAQAFGPRLKGAYKEAARAESLADSTKAALGIFKNGLTESEQRILALAVGDAAAGTIPMVLVGMFLYKNGWITGTTPDQPGDRGRNKTVGIPPMSIRDPRGNWHQLGALQPFFTPWAIGADLARDGKTIGTAMGAFGKAIGEAPMLKGISAVPETLKHPDSPRAETFANQIASGFVPTIAAQISSLGIPGIAAPDPYLKKADNPLQAMQAKLPGARNLVPQALTPLGQLIPEGNKLDPTRTVPPQVNEAIKAINEVGIMVTPLPKKIMVEDPNAALDSTGMAERQLTPDEYNKFQMLYGRAVLPEIQYLVGKPIPPQRVKAMPPEKQAKYRRMVETRKKFAMLSKAEKAREFDLILTQARNQAYVEIREYLTHPAEAAERAALEPQGTFTAPAVGPLAGRSAQ